MTEPIRIALIGAGIFAREAHIPAIMELDSTYQIVAIASRTLDSAKARAYEIPYPVEITTDVDWLLAREDIDAVDILLPIGMQADIVSAALASGKHVISEKPIAPDVATAKKLIDEHDGQKVWMVAENFRYEPAIMKASELVRDGAIGKPLLVTYTAHVPIREGNKYYETNWRQEMAFPGGWIMDGGVHHTAMLRLVVGEVTELAAVGQQNKEITKKLDTISAALKFANGAVGSYNITYVSGVDSSALVVAGDEGTIRMTRGSVEIVKENETISVPVEGMRSVTGEFRAFADAILHGTPHRNSPEEGLRDVAIIEAILRSAESGEFVGL